MYDMKKLMLLGLVGLMAASCHKAAVTTSKALAPAVPDTSTETTVAPVDPNVLALNAENAPMNSAGSREAGIKAGAKFGYIVSIQNSAIVFDEADFLNQQEAEKINAPTPDGFYINNPTKTTTKYNLSSNPIIRLISLENPDIGVGIRLSNVAGLQAVARGESTHRPVWLTFANNQVSAVEEQYLP